jgi:regulatory protein
MPRRTGLERLEARQARLERHAAETDPGVVLKTAARFLESRSRSVHEVRRHLAAAKFPDALADAAVARLLELGMLDDAAFGRAWVESRDRARPRGEQALRHELSLKGIDRETVDAILQERNAPETDADDSSHADGGADRRAAERLLARNRAALARVGDPRARRGRAYALLARNGFDPEVCREASARLVAAEPDADS